MRHPEKWRETADPFALPLKQFQLTRVLGYPHAGNDVFQVLGVYQQQEVEAFIKVARQRGGGSSAGDRYHLGPGLAAATEDPGA